VGKYKSKTQRSNAPVIALGVGAVALVGFMIWYGIKSSPPPSDATPVVETASPNGCTHSNVKVDIPGLENVPCVTENHVPMTQHVAYRTTPPLSGNHYDSWLSPGFYESKQTPELLVHNLQHGNIVVYYNRDLLSASELSQIKKLTDLYTADFETVIAVPYADKTHPVTLTAWENGLHLEKFDSALMDKFIDAFRGRGPEKPVR
jgi:hypothetical protein